MTPIQPARDRPPTRKGKVRDIYDLADRCLLIATDRMSAFDHILPDPIPDKGRVLTGLAAFWFRRIDVPNHLLSTDPDDAGLDLDPETRQSWAGRTMVVRAADVVPFECVVRGYLAGSGWEEYRRLGTVCGERLPAGLVEADRIGPILTPATKAEEGHDENVPFDAMADAVGTDLATRLRDLSLRVYIEAASYALERGLILADTKFEWGHDRGTGELMLVDEILTPDSSRYWAVETYRPGGSPPSFDKQFVRDWLKGSGWDRVGPPPSLPAGVIAGTRARYIEAYETLIGAPFPWP